MSALFGMINRSDQPVTTAALVPMMDALLPYGPDGAHTWTDQAVGFGHLMLHVTPESLTERLPAGAADYLALGGRSVQITADCRLDNRHELCQRLAIPAAKWPTIPDSQLILAAYARWGEACPEHLLGDFAFAIWDSDQQTLFCARDVIGARAFVYVQTAARFLFASDLDALLAVLEQPPVVNEPYLKGQLLNSSFSHPTQTLFVGLMKLAPAHSLTLNAKGLHLHRYWQPGQGAEIQLPADSAYAEMALDLLQQAVDCRLRSAYPIGSNLSGGMDSSAVTVLAARRLRQRGATLATFSWSPPVGADGYLLDDERPLVEAVCAQEGVTAHYAQPSAEDGLTAYKQGLQLFARFPIAPTLENAKTAHAQKIRVMLSGWGGDETISFGSKGYLLELLLTGQWWTLRHELPLRARHSNRHPVHLAYGLVRSLLMPEALRHWRQRRRQQRQAFRQPYFDPDFVARMANVSTLEMAPIPAWGQRRFQRALLANGHLTDRLVAWTAITTCYQMEWRHPLLDRRVIDFCLTIPPRLYHSNGWPRYLFNLAMTGVLPPAMVWRNHKTEPARMEQSYRTDNCALREFLTFLNDQTEKPIYPIVKRAALRANDLNRQNLTRERFNQRIQQIYAIQCERAINRAHQA